MRSRGAWAGAPAALLLAVPFATLISLTPWSQLALAPGDGRAVAVSISLGLIALALIALLGTPLALWLAHSRSRWRAPVQTLVMAALLTPPLAMGILLVSAYGPYGPVGQPLDRLGLALTNNAAAFLLAQLYGGLSYFVLSAKAAFENVPPALQEAAADLGASGWRIFRHITLPLAWRALATGLAIAWVRVIGEFGIVMIFAYFPQGIPVRLYVNLQNSGVEAVYVLVWLLLLVTLPLPMLLMSRRQSKFA